MRKKLILHDLSPADAKSFLPVASEEHIIFSATPPVHCCVGCFGCWIRTPGKCVIADRGADFVRPFSLCDEFIVISRLTFGGLSPDVKAVLDRSIGIVMPFFRYIGGETHHTKRYEKTPDLRYLFYGSDMTAREKEIAEKLAVANQINLGFGNPSAEFFSTARECAEALDARSVAALRSDTPGGARVKIALVNGSPKPGGSASKLILEALQERIGSSSDCTVCNAVKQERDEFIRAIARSDAIVFIFPLYVDGIPSHLLRLLDEASGEIADAAPGATVYAVVNNGLYEGWQNTLAFEMMRRFVDRAGLSWGGGTGAGAGGMIHVLTIGRGPLKKLGAALDSLAQNITNRVAADDCTLEPAFPRFLYKAAAHSEWRRGARKNNLTVKQLYKK
jgi:multimeric flavodoxin WrbA